MNTEKLENIAQMLIMIVVGIAAGAVSVVHVHDWTVARGQPSPVGLVNAAISELMQIALGIELGRRVRTAARTGTTPKLLVVGTALFLVCGVSLLAQLSQAGPGPEGKLAAVLPMLAFVGIVKLAMSRTPTPVPVADPVPVPGQTRTEPAVAAVDAGLAPAVPGRPRMTPDDPGRPETRKPAGRPAPDPVPVPAVPVPALVGATRSLETNTAAYAAVSRRPGHRPPTADPDPVTPSPAAVPVPDPDPVPVQAALDLTADPDPAKRNGNGNGVVPARTGHDPETDFDPAYIAAGNEVIATLTRTGQKLNRDAFLDELRTNHNIRLRTNVGGQLYKHLRDQRLVSA